jgi:hypothetical protein
LQEADELEPGQAVILNGKFTSGDGKELSSHLRLRSLLYRIQEPKAFNQ